MNRLINLGANVFVMAALLTAIGCGESDTTWPSKIENDWIKNVNGKGMANVWGVIFDVDGIELDCETSINPDAILGPTFSETTGKNVIVFGKKVVELETTGTKALKLSINGRPYGKVHVDSRVTMDTDGNVYVDQKSRKPLK